MNLLELNESRLGLIENNDPGVTELTIKKSNWIKRAGRAIGDSKLLRNLDIRISSGETEGTWLGDLLQHLPRNRSIESLRVLLDDPIPGGEHYSYELEWDIFHMLTPFIEHNNNFRSIQLLWGTSAMLSSLALALSNCENKRLERINLVCVLSEDDFDQFFGSLAEYNNLVEIRARGSFIGTLGSTALSNLLRNPATKIHDLALTDNALDDEQMVTLSIGLMRSKSMKSLDLSRNHSVTAKGWGALSSILFHPMCKIECLSLEENVLGDEGITYLGEALTANKSVQHLDLFSIEPITHDGWREFLKCLRNPDSSLNCLYLAGCGIDDDVAAMIMNALEENVSLKRLILESNHITSRGLVTIFNSLLNCDIFVEEIDLEDNWIEFGRLTEEDWNVLSRALCDKSSIDSAYTSNHSLFSLLLDDFEYTEDWLDEVWVDLLSWLSMNKNPNKAEVAREKILDHHLSDEHANKSVFAGMSEPVLPHAIEWVGQDNDGLSAMYNLVRCLPTLFDVNNKMSCEE